MKSCLYECRVMHQRFSPRAHRFVYRISPCALDPGELEQTPPRLGLFSVNRANLHSFRDRDYLPVRGTKFVPEMRGAGSNPPAAADQATPVPPPAATLSLRQRVAACCVRQGVDIAGGRVILVTLPRVFGYLLNPVSFYFRYDRDGRPAAAAAEVTNTFREVKPCFLGPDTAAGWGEFHVRVPKHFYGSPFSDVDVTFDFTLRTPGDRLAIRIDDCVGGERTLTSTLTGPRRELTPAHIAWFSVKHPLITVRIIARTHWHALRLWLKRVPWFTKAARPSAQRALYRPHHSLQLSDAS